MQGGRREVGSQRDVIKGRPRAQSGLSRLLPVTAGLRATPGGGEDVGRVGDCAFAHIHCGSNASRPGVGERAYVPGDNLAALEIGRRAGPDIG